MILDVFKMRRFALKLFLISLLGAYPTVSNALEAGDLLSICKPYKLRNYQPQHTADKYKDILSRHDDLRCLSVTSTILDFASSLCLQAHQYNISKSEMGTLYHYTLSSDIQPLDAIDAFIGQYDPDFEKAPAHLIMLQALGKVSRLNKCNVLK